MKQKLIFRDIHGAIEKAGYKAIDNAVSKTMKIEGMTCQQLVQRQ